MIVPASLVFSPAQPLRPTHPFSPGWVPAVWRNSMQLFEFRSKASVQDACTFSEALYVLCVYWRIGIVRGAHPYRNLYFSL